MSGRSPHGARLPRSERQRTVPAGASTVRVHNLTLLLEHLRSREPLSRARLADGIGLTRATVSSLVDELLVSGLLEELPAGRGGPGRPANPLRLNRSGPVGLGVAVEPDRLRACVVDLTATVLAEETLELDTAQPDAGPVGTLALAAALGRSLLARVGQPVTGCGLALPGVVNSQGVLAVAPNLPGWAGSDPGALLADALGVAVNPANEADLAACAELWFGQHPGLTDFLHVSGEVGVGAGIVLGGRLFRGPGGRAGELGHVVVDPRGPRCSCGGRGCLEQAAGLRVLLERSGTSGVEELAVAAQDGHEPALAALSAAGAALGVAVSDAVNLLDVPVVVLGGVYARLRSWVLPNVRAELQARALARPAPQVLVSTLGSGAAVRGAAATVVRALLEDPRREPGRRDDR